MNWRIKKYREVEDILELVEVEIIIVLGAESKVIYRRNVVRNKRREFVSIV
jgi:hypothetical protein